MKYARYTALIVIILLPIASRASSSPARLAVSSVSVPTEASIVREDLTADEQAAPQRAGVILRLRNLAELDARIQRGDIVSPAEMEARYYPTHETWVAVANWAQSQGLAVDPEDSTHMSVTVRGQVAQVATAFQTRFARVHGSDGIEYTAAVAPATVPTDIAPYIAGVSKLQPQNRVKPSTTYQPITTNLGNYGPQYLLDTYGATGVGDGTGQTIAIFGFQAPPSSTDLTTYWAKIGSPHTLADVTIINPDNYPTYNDDLSQGLTPGYEVTMDVEIVSGLCPGAKIRVYCLDDPEATAQGVLADLSQFPSIHQLSISGGNPESVSSPATTSQYFMALAAQGVTSLAGSGDGGSNPLASASYLSYGTTAPLSVSYPASDPYVTGVGGTTQVLNYTGPSGTNTGPITGVLAELAWTAAVDPVVTSQGTTFDGNNHSMSGGGISTAFTRPSWQTGPGLPAGSMRAVPDVAAAANGGQGGGLYIYDGAHDEEAAGTSESCPVWAALTAILNQNLQATGHPPVGLLTAKLYPLAGTTAMSYVPQGYISYLFGSDPSFWGMLQAGTADTNGAYSVGPTYDCITGIGTPNIAQIATALEAPPAGLSVSVATQLPSGVVANGSAPITLQAIATGSPTGYQWELNGVPIAGATGATQIVYPTAANEGAYSVVVTNSVGSASTSAGTLNVSTDAWIVNLSSRAYAETGANELIAGFVTTGPNQKTVLIRGDGPSLGVAPFNITDALTDPQLTLIANGGSTPIAVTNGWAASLASTFAQVGAFPFAAGSHDDAILETLSPGGYTAQVTSATTNNGVALAEIYDADGLAPTDRLINISARAFVGTGGNILIGGFVIGGNTPQTVIIRADGPALGAAPFNLGGALANTTLTLDSQNGAVIASNSGWGNVSTTGPGATGGIVIQPLTAALSAKVGGFALAANSGDSGIVATLPPGPYTAEVSGVNGTTGIALVEIYEVR
jgi:kumamolisin